MAERATREEQAPNPAARRVQAAYFTLLIGNTLAASFIWGVNTLFLLDAGLTNFEAFAANAFFSVGMVIFEVPTGVVADTLGRRVSYLLGTVTLAVTTVLYYLLWVAHSPFWMWAIVSVLLGLGFTFFSGAVEAWLVDALAATGYTGGLERVFGRGLALAGAAMFIGSILGGVIAQATNLGVPFLIRAGILVVMFVVAAIVMHDLGFTPAGRAHPIRATKEVFDASVKYGLGRRPVRYVMFASFFTTGVGFYVFYALQPYLVELWGDTGAYSIAGLAAAILSGSQVIGGLVAPWVRRRFRKRTTTIILSLVVSSLVLLALGVNRNFWIALVLLTVWGLVDAAAGPVQQAYLNDMIPSQQRATVLSFDSLLGSTGGAVIQPVLGRSADLWGYPGSLLVSGGIQALAVPFLWLSRRQGSPADVATDESPERPEEITESGPPVG
ncbi:MFS transporter [Agromyces cerinus]|uniref:Predicted arabinose efflux permease, MFS family n=1 Tax=Agromyces cerinus subsp. cerinus TaxID=232089 RepID=A0A1N6EN90_9MICO|nr:MFS transporter [Agromyces cerinus]SIN84413.1 Predicted arabinose efflux permease, MFS family [Agromyces cerinus subsp. cerinus]